MKKITSQLLKVIGLALAFVLVWNAQSAMAAGFIGSQLGVGSQGADVSTLQTFLASNPSIYPEARVTGYFGPLTQKAVAAFQVAYDLPAVGRVGPLTLAKLNSVMAGNFGLDISAPRMTNLVVQPLSTSATVSWYTNESARAKVFYGTQPITVLEASQSFIEPVINSMFVSADANFRNSQSVMLQNLASHTTYYYIAESIDASGNVNVSSQGTFTTN